MYFVIRATPLGCLVICVVKSEKEMHFQQRIVHITLQALSVTNRYKHVLMLFLDRIQSKVARSINKWTLAKEFRK